MPVRIGTVEIIVLAVIVIIFFGGKKIPEFFRGLGQSISEFKKSAKGENKEEDKE